MALPEDGHIFTIERDQNRIRMARETFLHFENYSHQITLLEGKAIDVLQTLKNEPLFDLIFIDADNDGIRDANEQLIKMQEKFNGIKIVTNRPITNNVSYIGTGESRSASGSSGGGFQAGTFTICPAAKGKGVQLILARGGRVRVAKIDEEKCNAV